MEKIKVEKNWVSKKMLRRIMFIWLVLILIGVLFHGFLIVSIIISVLSALMLLLLLYAFYAHYQLSPQGGDFQSKVSSLVTDRINGEADGKLLDIGCGSGVLSVELALKCPHLKISGVDYWEGLWGYAKEKCERLAKDYNVSDRICFEKASALSLPFEDEAFDIVISNMVFHEVADAKDKREVIKEALRVLKKGGVFVFQDLLLSEKLYGKPEELVRYVKNLGIESVSLTKASDQISIPALLKTPLFFGYAGMLLGIK